MTEANIILVIVFVLCPFLEDAMLRFLICFLCSSNQQRPTKLYTQRAEYGVASARKCQGRLQCTSVTYIAVYYCRPQRHGAIPRKLPQNFEVHMKLMHPTDFPQNYYGSRLETSADLQTNAASCSMPSRPMLKSACEALKLVHPEVCKR